MPEPIDGHENRVLSVIRSAWCYPPSHLVCTALSRDLNSRGYCFTRGVFICMRVCVCGSACVCAQLLACTCAVKQQARKCLKFVHAKLINPAIGFAALVFGGVYYFSFLVNFKPHIRNHEGSLT